MAALTPDQQRSVSESGGYYDVDGNWIDLSEGGPPNPPNRPPTTQRAPQQGGSGVNPWLAILSTLGGVLGGNYLRNSGASNNVPPELRQMLQMSMDRQAYQNPMFQAATQGTYQMLPNFARQGTELKGTLSNTPPPAPANSGSGSGGSDNPYTSLNPLKNPLLAGLLGALGGRALGGPGSGGGGPLDEIGKAIANLFRRGDTNIFGGRQTYSGRPGAFDPYGGADNPYYYGNVPGYGGDPNTGFNGLPGYGYDWPPPDPFAGLPGYGTNMPEPDPFAGLPGYGTNMPEPDPFAGLPGYGTPLPDLGGGGINGGDPGQNTDPNVFDDGEGY